MLVATLAWGLFEVGFDGWGLAPRLIAPALLGLCFLADPIRRRTGMTNRWWIHAPVLAIAAVIVLLRYMQALDIPHDKMNVCGGAIAMGHPLGATGAMILGTVLDELERSGKSTALITLCIGMGMGTATIIERV